MLNPYVDRNFNTDKEGLKESLCQFYTTDLSEDTQSLKATHCYADLSFIFPTLKMLENHAAGTGTTYQYQFSRESSKPINIGGPPPKWFRGAGHAEELKYMFDMSRLFKHLDLGLTDGEKTLSRNIIQYWTSFAKTGRPVAGKESVQWKEFDLQDRSYIDLDVPTTMKKSLKPDMYKFLNENFPPLTHEKHERDEL
ncbi:CEL [Mytilus coruscus]|uniref:CEL n=1 Tax=Mytilus coruscus TaxID=42192 RepID=A0A6J8ATL0_MYTCO|nr:CEL [Mytilus coruscus]